MVNGAQTGSYTLNGYRPRFNSALATEERFASPESGRQPNMASFHAKVGFMKINVKVPEELAAQAEALGLALEAYVEQILAQQIREHKAEGQTPRTPKEIRAWLDSLAQFSDKVPPLPEKITREWIYQDHD